MKKSKGIDVGTAALLLEHHYNRKPGAIKRLHGGIANHVFETCMGKEELVLRIAEDPAKLPVFMKEQWATSTARKHGIPVPEILEVANHVINLPYMISRKVSGRSGEKIGKGRREIVRELGKYAALINSIPTSDFGHIFDWSPNKLSRNATWSEFLDSEMNVAARLETFERARVLTPANLRKLESAVRSMRRWKKKPSLTHGDLRLKNVILDADHQITAILDWENCTSNIAPYWELSIALHDLTMDEKQIFLEGYGLPPKDYAKLAPGIKALNLLNYSGVVADAAEKKDRNALDGFRARLNGAFDLYSL